MTTTIVVTFPWGRYHGTPWGRNVNEGVVDWPPEPWRIVRALYATWRSRAPELDADVMASLLDTLAEPPTYRAPAHRVAHTRHYFPDAKHGPTHGTDKVLDTFAVMERGAELHVTWPADLTEPERQALAVLCDRITYLGRAESVCVARLLGPDKATGTPAPDAHVVAPLDDDDLHAALTGTAGGPPALLLTDALAPAGPTFDQLEANPQRLRSKGLLQPPGSRRVTYPAVPEAAPSGRTPSRHEPPKVTAVRLRLTGNPLPLLTRAVAVADATRGAALRMLDAEGTGQHSLALSGRSPAGERATTDHHHAHYLAFPSADAHKAGGALRVDTVVIWAPGGLDAHEVDAVTAIRRLHHGYGRQRWQAFVAVEAAGGLADVAPELTGPAHRWRSLTPYAAPRHVKRRHATWDDQAADRLRRDVDQLTEAGLLGPSTIVDVAPAAGLARHTDWRDFVRHRPGKENRPDDRRATGFTVTFADPVAGPLALGALRHFGLGLFVPDDSA